MTNKTKFIILVMIVVAFAFLFRFTPLSHYLGKEGVLSFLGSIRENWWGPVVFIAIYAIGCVVAFPGSILTLTGGAVFGTAWGTAYNVIASNLGATLAFLAARYFGRDFIQGLVRNGKLAKLDKEIEKSGFKTIFRLRLIPLVPFNGLNFGAAFSSVRYKDYFWGTLLGMLPATFIYTYFAGALLQGVREASQKAYLNITVAALLLIFVSFFPAIYKKIKGVNSRG
ncbi:MAG: TVP38/TMEM64 family protein [Candidatus Omnitrophica bacterium]|nr:TVP38/TMEM64 family protein [Candidatus Omnitrophota bacterium]